MNATNNQRKLPLWNKITYGFGDLGCGMSNGFVAAFFLIFCTDVFGISAGAVATLLLLGRFWDMINDTWVGAWTDRTRSKFGKYRPWIIFATIPLFVITVLMFWAHPEWNDTAKIVWIYVFYLLWAFAFTCVNVPYTAMNSVMSQSDKDRGSLASWRMVFTNVSTLVSVTFCMPLVAFFGGNEGNPVRGWLVTIGLAAVAGIVLLYICVFTCKEVVTHPVQAQAQMPILKGAAIAFKNKYFVMGLIGMFAFGLMNLGRMSVQSFYFTYVLGDVGAMSLFGTVTGIAGIIGAFGSQYICNALRSKGRAAALLAFGTAIFTTVWFLGGSSNSGLFWVSAFLSYVCSWATLSVMFAVTPDTVEYGLLTTGVRQDGFYGAYASFWHKAGIALGSAGAGWVLEGTGYIPNAPEQAPAVITGINTMMFILPIILSVLIGIVFLFYKIDYDRFAQIVDEIKAKYGDNIVESAER